MSAGDMRIAVTGPVYAGPGHGWLQPPAVVSLPRDVADRVLAVDPAALVGGDVAADQAVTSPPVGVPLEDMTIPQLRAHAAQVGIAVPSSARTKPAILQILTDGTAADPEVVDLAGLSDEALLDLAAEWGVEPGDADRDELVALLTAHRATQGITA
jgi:hypothetical protein